MHAHNRPGYALAHHARRSRVRTEDPAGHVAPAMLAPHDRENPRRATGPPARLERRQKRWLAARAAKAASHIGLVRRRGQGDLRESDCLAQSTPTRSQGCRSGKRVWGRTHASGSVAQTDLHLARDPASEQRRPLEGAHRGAATPKSRWRAEQADRELRSRHLIRRTCRRRLDPSPDPVSSAGVRAAMSTNRAATSRTSIGDCGCWFIWHVSALISRGLMACSQRPSSGGVRGSAFLTGHQRRWRDQLDPIRTFRANIPGLEAGSVWRVDQSVLPGCQRQRPWLGVRSWASVSI